MTEVPGVNYTFEVVRDWYDWDRPGYEPEFIRATYIPLAWKSKISNSDMGSNFFADSAADIKKGDILIREDGEIYLLDWKVQRRPNTQTTQAKDCNVMMLTLMSDMARGAEGGSQAFHLYEVALNSAGIAQEKYQVYLESVEAAQGAYKNSLEALFATFMSGENIKGYYNMITGLVTLFTQGLQVTDGWTLKLPA